MDEWQIEDHLLAFSYRTKPLKAAFTKLFDAGLHVFVTLWPEAEVPRSPIALAEALFDAGRRLTEWRYSAGRASADETLSYVLGWYETINFEVVQTIRTASKFNAEEEWIQRRQELANFFTERADLHTFIPNLPFMDEAAADGEEVEEEGEGEAVDSDEGEAEAAPRTEATASGSGGGAEAEAPPA